MSQIVANILEATDQTADFAALTFIEDSQYEFIGGGAATNGY